MYYDVTCLVKAFSIHCKQEIRQFFSFSHVSKLRANVREMRYTTQYNVSFIPSSSEQCKGM